MKREQFIAYINDSVAKFLQEEKSLAESDRKDESNLVKIRINVYGICKSIYESFAKIKEGEAFQEEYVRKLTDLSQSWKTSYEKAKEHHDVEKIVIEEIKIQALEEIKNKFLEIWR